MSAMMPPHYLIDDVLLSRSPQQLGDDVVQRLRVSAAIRPVKEADPPVFHPVGVHSQEQHEANSQRGRPDVPVDLLHPLVADGAGRDDEGGAGGDGLHGDEAVGAVERRGPPALFPVVHAVGVLPQLAVHALDAGLVVQEAQLATDALKAVVRAAERDRGPSGGGVGRLLGFEL
ncbi:hypothetical protein EYF80_011515 [Liparis tanakae]|uniref:Uncharacterized protein n=1 Tax=Liparis tanakae TaxID=230148 RepID=A0A4Z2IKE5_9TELE|nr:hypothetical protein EYF80_011515 [Liparis tanakae]